MKNKILIGAIIILSFTVSQAQLKKIQRLFMQPEIELFENSEGKQYSTLLNFKVSKNLFSKAKSNIYNYKNANNKNFVKAIKELDRKYGVVKISRIFPKAFEGKQSYYSKSKKKTILLTDLSLHYSIHFTKPIPVIEVIGAIKSIENIQSANLPASAESCSTPNDYDYVNNTNNSRWAFEAMRAEDAWNITTGSSSIHIGISELIFNDAPFSNLHSELINKVKWSRTSKYTGHSFTVAGLAAAETNNSVGIAGMGWNTSLKMSGHQMTQLQDLLLQKPDVVNMSWISGPTPEFKDLIKSFLEQDIIIVAGAGNADIHNPPSSTWIPQVMYPAAYNFDAEGIGQVIAVTSTELVNGLEQRVSNFNYSPGTNPITSPEESFIDFAAPGVGLRSLSPNSTTGYANLYPGTSYSAPLVAGVIALIKSVNPNLEPKEVFDLLKQTADKIGQYTYDSNGWNQYMGYGRINAANAVNVAQGAPRMPINFTHVVNTTHPQIQWSLNTETNITGYEIYRQYDEGQWSLRATVGSTTNQYTDTQVNYTKPDWAKKVNYKVRAINSASKKSIFSLPERFIGIIGGPDMQNKQDDDNKVISANIEVKENKITNFPNPFNPTTKIEYSIKEKSNVKIVVYNMLGQEITTLVNGEKSAGTYYATFDASGLPSGMYYCKMVSNNFNKTIKMLLTK